MLINIYFRYEYSINCFEVRQLSKARFVFNLTISYYSIFTNIQFLYTIFQLVAKSSTCFDFACNELIK